MADTVGIHPPEAEGRLLRLLAKEMVWRQWLFDKGTHSVTANWESLEQFARGHYDTSYESSDVFIEAMGTEEQKAHFIGQLLIRRGEVRRNSEGRAIYTRKQRE
jgi:hypothetical protein